VNNLEFTLLVALGSLFAGFVGALTGLGGGVVIIPMLTLLFHVDIRYAMGASLISVIATSSGAAAAYVKQGFSNVRIGMFLEMATAAGAITGATIATRVSTAWLAVALGIVLLYSAVARNPDDPVDSGPPPEGSLAARLRLTGTYPATPAPISYFAQRVPVGFSLMYMAGLLSGLLGIGSGAIKVLALDRAMRLPFKVSTTTSNFMIGVTAAAGAGVFLRHGFVRSGLAIPVMLGVLGGSMAGAWVLLSTSPGKLKMFFRVILAILAIEMIYQGLSKKL
jgi:uncharacterized protein